MITLSVIGFIIVFLLVLASGLPVGFGLGVLAMGLLTFLADFDTAMTSCIEKIYTSMNSNILVAVPLFVLAAQLIGDTGMGKRLFDAAKAFLGRFKAGLGMSTIISSGIFAAMTGSSVVAASTMGMIAIPELRKAKYPDSLISSAIAGGGSLGAVIPPSIILIIYGYLTDESIGKLFAAGMVPGLLLIIGYIIGMQFMVQKLGLNNAPAAVPTAEGVADEPPDEERVLGKWEALKEAFFGLLAPVIILGGIYLGIFTASEAAAVAVIYCSFVGFFVYRNMTIKKYWASLIAAANVTSMIAIILVGGAMVGYVVVYGRIPQEIIEIVTTSHMHPMLLLLMVNVVLFIAGMFLDILALVYLAIPLLQPVVLHMGWDNIWFAIIFLLNVNLALITPPMGGILFLIAQLGGINIQTVVRGALLPVFVILILLVMLIFFPPIATWLPGMIG